MKADLKNSYGDGKIHEPVNVIIVTGLRQLAQTAKLDESDFQSHVVNMVCQESGRVPGSSKGMNVLPYPVQECCSDNNSRRLSSCRKYIVMSGDKKALLFTSSDFSSMGEDICATGVTNVIVFSRTTLRKNSLSKILKGIPYNYIKITLPKLDLGSLPMVFSQAREKDPTNLSMVAFLQTGDNEHHITDCEKITIEGKTIIINKTENTTNIYHGGGNHEPSLTKRIIENFAVTLVVDCIKLLLGLLL